jgi:hypothetical protein
MTTAPLQPSFLRTDVDFQGRDWKHLQSAEAGCGGRTADDWGVPVQNPIVDYLRVHGGNLEVQQQSLRRSQCSMIPLKSGFVVSGSQLSCRTLVCC